MMIPFGTGCIDVDGSEFEYYRWLTCDHIPKWENYTSLLQALYTTPFMVSLLMDENRVGDGLDMRNRFIYQNDVPYPDSLRNCRPCSVLEVMIGLAQRYEEEYMTQYDTEDHPIGTWFWPMVDSLGLRGYDNQHFDWGGFNQIMSSFLNRTYSPDGRGSLFYIPNIDVDMRQIEIWRQMMIYYRGGIN